MKKRKLAILLKTKTFSNIKKIKDLILYNTPDGSIVLNKENIYIHIYGFQVENNLYFDVYSLKDARKSDLRVLLEETSKKKERLKVYEKYRTEYVNSITDPLSYNALFSEQDFFIFIEMLSLFMDDLFEYPLLEKYVQYFTPMTDQQKKCFEAVLNSCQEIGGNG